MPAFAASVAAAISTIFPICPSYATNPSDSASSTIFAPNGLPCGRQQRVLLQRWDAGALYRVERQCMREP